MAHNTDLDPTNHRHDADTGGHRALWAAYAFFVGPLSGSSLERSVLFGSVFAACVLSAVCPTPGVRLPLVTAA